jgi:cell filamentation protein
LILLVLPETMSTWISEFRAELLVRKYDAVGPEAEFEPGSRGRVLRNLLGITRVRDIEEVESRALDLAQDVALERFSADHRFTAKDICALHWMWLGSIYSWAGKYRSVNVSKAGFQFAHAPLIENLMSALEQDSLRQHTPCHKSNDAEVSAALAEVHGELILIHPFRDGNGRLARLLTLLMALQAGLPTLDFSSLLGRCKRRYIAGIHSALDRNYAPVAELFAGVIDRSRRRVASNKQ